MTSPGDGCAPMLDLPQVCFKGATRTLGVLGTWEIWGIFGGIYVLEAKKSRGREVCGFWGLGI